MIETVAIYNFIDLPKNVKKYLDRQYGCDGGSCLIRNGAMFEYGSLFSEGGDCYYHDTWAENLAKGKREGYLETDGNAMDKWLADQPDLNVKRIIINVSW